MEPVTTYGDTDVLRRRADQLREQALDVRTLGDQLVARTESIGWTGRAAESMRERVAERAAHLRDVAVGLDDAADALDRHLLEVDHVVEAIAEREHRATALVTDARARVAAVESPAEPDPDDLAVLALTAPPRGHLDWLDVELPGL